MNYLKLTMSTSASYSVSDNVVTHNVTAAIETAIAANSSIIVLANTAQHQFYISIIIMTIREQKILLFILKHSSSEFRFLNIVFFQTKTKLD